MRCGVILIFADLREGIGLACGGCSCRDLRMPEVRNSGSRAALADPSGGGFFIRRMASPGAVVVKGAAVKPLAQRVLRPSSNKENVPPSWAVTLRTTPKRRSPLPEWYPRSPLRDVTSVVKAVERKSRLGNAAARQQIQLREDSSRSVDPATPVQTEDGVPRSTPTPPTQKLLDAAAPCPGSTQAVATTSTAYLAEGKPKASSSPSDCSFQTPSRPNDPALADLMEKELSSSIEQIEKMVKKNLKRAPKAAQPPKVTIQKRTLMSMR
uniref:Uncharacterized protein n=1 Tax=Oryza punctata TaxID=4537 RepID=A0A0E0K1S9_ORYPU